MTNVRATVAVAFLASMTSMTSVACVQDPTVPKLGGRAIELKIRQSAAIVVPGGTDTITVSAVNHLAESVRILFPVDVPCQILVYIHDASARTVVPEDGYRNCVPVPSQMTIPADSTVERTYIWKGFTQFEPSGSATRLPPGEYSISAVMNASGFSVPGFAVKVTVAP